MAKRRIKDTLAANPDLERDSARYRRECAVRRVLERHGDPMMMLGRLMATATDRVEQRECAKALMPYIYPQCKAIELTGPDGEGLTVQIVKVSATVSASGPVPCELVAASA